jgi:hypothetical protein
MALCRPPAETRLQTDSQVCLLTPQIVFASTNITIAGALGMGQRASFGLGQFNSFWSYTTPIVGAIIADEYLGRFNTIFVAIAFSIVGHIFLIVSALPVVLLSGKAIAPFIIGLILLGFGTGAFKANISPLIAEQYRATKLRVVVEKKTGERVIMDPNITLSRIFLVSLPSLLPQQPQMIQQLITWIPVLLHVHQYRFSNWSDLHGLCGEIHRVSESCDSATDLFADLYQILGGFSSTHYHVLLLPYSSLVLPWQVCPHAAHRFSAHPRRQTSQDGLQGQMVDQPCADAQEPQK